MSKIGKKPVEIPQGVTVEVRDDEVIVKGPKGELRRKYKPEFVEISVEDGKVIVKAKGDRKRYRAMHGTTRAIINNMVIGVTKGFSKTLIVKGMGYKVAQKGKGVDIQVGYSHPVIYEPPEGITLKVVGNNKIIVEGIDKELVGQVAAEIRAIRPPDAYKGKGIMYEGEKLRLKPGKAGKAK